MQLGKYLLVALVALTGCRYSMKLMDKPEENPLRLKSKCEEFLYGRTENGFYVEGPFERKDTENGVEKIEKYEGRIEFVEKHPEHDKVVRIATTYKGMPVKAYDGWKENRADGNFDRLEVRIPMIGWKIFDLPDGSEIKAQNGFKAGDISETKKNCQNAYTDILELIKRKFGEFTEIPLEKPLEAEKENGKTKASLTNQAI